MSAAHGYQSRLIIPVGLMLIGSCGGEDGDTSDQSATSASSHQLPDAGVSQDASTQDAASATSLDSIGGHWVWTLGNGAFWEFELGADGSYALDVFATVDGTSLVQRQLGTYTLSGDSMVITLSSSSCVGDTATPYPNTVSTDGQVLSLKNSNGNFLLAPFQTSRQGSQIIFGCWVNGQLTPGPVQPVQPAKVKE